MQNLVIKVVDKEYLGEMAIENVVKYIYRDKNNPKNYYPTHAYLEEYQGYGLTPEEIVRSFEYHQIIGENQLFHVIFTFDADFPNPNGNPSQYINTIAFNIGHDYPCCFAFHRKNSDTNNCHAHFHLVIMAESYTGIPQLDKNTLRDKYLEYAKGIAPYYGYNVNEIYL